MKSLQENGANIIELGMPYSDPLADGPVIQQSGSIALANGMTIAKLFEQLKDFRKAPLGDGAFYPGILMGYMNPVLQYGFEKFCADAAAVGIDGLIFLIYLSMNLKQNTELLLKSIISILFS